MVIVMSVESFAAKRRGDQDSMEKDLYPHVAQAMQAHPVDGWYNDLLAEVARQYLSVFHNEGGTGQPDPSAAEFTADVRATLDKTENPTAATTDRVSVWLATAILNAGTQAAAATDEEFLVMEWVTMHDEAVRIEHQLTAGQQQPPGEPFDVDGVPMRYPGDPLAPIELWINCRCSLAPLLAEDATFRKNEGVTMTATDAEQIEQIEQADEFTPTPWHGILAPEGVWSGDGRQFAADSLRFRDLPLPLTWQKATDQGHDGSVVVGRIDQIDRVDGMMRGSGIFLATTEASEVIGLLAEFGRFGVSVDADDAEFELNEDDGKVTFTSARIASASIVAIPAFAEAFIEFGQWADDAPADETDDDVCNPDSPAYDPDACAKKNPPVPAMSVHSHSIYTTTSTGTGPLSWTTNGYSAPAETFVSDKPWSDFSQSDYSDEQWKRACILHKCDGSEKSCHGLPIKEPGGALNRNGVHAAASRFNQVNAPAEAKAKAKASLRSAYKQLGEEPPDKLKAAAELATFKRGPGWVTDPVATKRIHDYWTKKGEPGYIKINWGVPGDFNRCRALVGEEIAENSPEDTVYLNQICARWHHDALGFWPGRPTSGDTVEFDGDPAPALTLVASAGPKAPAGWFADPNLSGPTHLSVTEDGRVYGHIAEWSACHIGYEGVCVSPPQSPSGYAYYATGRVLLDDGSVARTGVISLGGGHAKGKGLRPQAAVEHYDSTSAGVADVCVGEDDYGIWCAGWIRPGTSDEQVVALRASDISGDWREVRPGQMEMVAALACNVGGFPTVTVGIEDGRQIALVAAGRVEQSDPVEDLVVQVEQRLVAREDRRKRMRELASRVGTVKVTQFGCNCGGSKNNKSQEWVYSFGGQTKIYRTEIEARAAQIRNGGGTITTRVRT